MIANQSIAELIIRLWSHFTLRRQRQFMLLSLLILLCSFAEILSIGAVLPFLGALTTPERIFKLSAMQPFIQALELTEPKQLILPLTITFAAAALISGALRLLLLWVSAKLSFAAGADLSISIYRRTLYQPYTVHCARNSSEIINGISGKVDVVIFNIIVPTLTFISSGTMLVVILIAIMTVDPVIALAAFIGFGLIYSFIVSLTRNKLLFNSQVSARESLQVIKSLQEGLGGIRDVLIDGSQTTYCKIYKNADLPLRRAQGNIMFISSSPRYYMEALGMVLIAILAYSLSQQVDGITKAIPILGAMAMGAQRLLPTLQQVYAAWATIQGSHASLKKALELLDQPLPAYADQPVGKSLPFNHCISLKQVNFRYGSQTPYILKKLTLTITKGSRIGFIGATGSGKSTLLDIIMGLLQPTDGTLEIDNQKVTLSNNRAWQAHIAHVPQAIYLSDSSVEENIAFGIPKDQIDIERVRKVALQAQIAESIESLPSQYQTLVGERGIQLSGGQRQRIGIARALYKQADVIIFDEATSALDNETEHSVMQAIEGLSKDHTLLIIAHRLTTLKNCQQIVELGEGGIKRIGSYKEIVDKKMLAIKNKRK
jgi:ATP-binding cassette subfamily B protein